MSDPIDLIHLDKYVCGDVALTDEILTIFAEQADSWMTRLSADMTDDDWYHACHALKGASRGVGAWSVGDLAEEGERLMGDNASEIARIALLEKLQHHVDQALQFAIHVRDNKLAG